MGLCRHGVAHACAISASLILLFAAMLMWSPVANAAGCSNEALRTGKSALLPDCRAFELVSPPGTSGLFVGEANGGLPLNQFATEKVAATGSSFLFMTEGGALQSPPEPTGVYDQYQAVRTAAGWVTVRRVSPSGSQAVLPNSGGTSADHSYSFYNVGPVFDSPSGGTLAEDGEANYLGKPDGSFELLGVGALGSEPLAEGRWISPGGGHVIFTTGGPRCGGSSTCEVKQLELNAPPTGTPAVYERGPNGPTRVVSLLPGNLPVPAGEGAQYQGASADGSTVAFRVGETLYVRVDATATEEVVTGESIFGGVSANGSKVLYVLNGNIFSFDTSSEQTTAVNVSNDAELVSVSADGSHVYFTSFSLLDGSKGIEGEANLYMWSAATGIVFVATVSPLDLSGIPSLTAWTSRVVDPAQAGGVAGPGASSARTTPTGDVLAFESHAKLTGYENAEHVEIYRFDSGDDSLVCVSCNPRQEPATLGARLEPVNLPVGVSTEALIHNLSADGQRIFFETEEALLSRDSDGINDIYEWQANGSEPVLSLISTGATPDYPGIFGTRTPTNLIFGINPSGSDVVFGSWEQLLPSAGSDGVRSIYDARIGGGFAEPLATPCAVSVCEAASTAPPALDSPSSNRFAGKGNVRRHRGCRAKKGRRAKRCHKARHRHHTRSRHRANRTGRVGK